MAISLDKVQATAPGLVNLYKTAKVNLERASPTTTCTGGC